MTVRVSLTDTNKTYVRRKKLKTVFCTYCPYHGGENITRRGHSQWGKKKAAKKFYASGKGRKKPKRYYKDIWYQNLGDYTYKVLSV